VIAGIGWAVSQNGSVHDADAAVTDGKVTTVQLYPKADATIQTGNTLQLTAQAFDPNNRPVTTGVDYTWQTISRGGTTGKITSAGSQATLTADQQAGIMGVVVTATSGKYKASDGVNVVIQPKAGIDHTRIYPIVGHIATGAKTDFLAENVDTSGKSLDSGVTYKWRVDNSPDQTNASIIGTTAGGKATISGGTKEGVFNLWVEATYQGKTVNTAIQVSVYEAVKLSRVTLYPLIGIAKTNGSVNLTATSFDTNNKQIATGDVQYKWTMLTGSDIGASLLSNKNTAVVSTSNKKGIVRLQVQATKGGVSVYQATYVVVQ